MARRRGHGVRIPRSPILKRRNNLFREATRGTYSPRRIA